MATKAPKLPDPRSVSAIVDYLAEWAKILIPPSKGLDDLVARLPEAKKAPGPQEAVARAIYLGPPASAVGADRWLKVATTLQAWLKGQTGEAPVASRLGGALADAARVVVEGTKGAISSATGAAASAAAAVGASASKAAADVATVAGRIVPGTEAPSPGLMERITGAVGRAIPAAADSMQTALKWVLGGTLAAIGGGGFVTFILPGIVGIWLLNKLLPYLPGILKAIK